MHNRNTILFVDRAIDSAETLISGLQPKDTVCFLSRSGGPLTEIASALTGRRNVDRLVILAHGSPGTIEFSGNRVDCDSLRNNETALANIKAALAPDAELVLASCSTGAGAAGTRFVDALGSTLDVTVLAATEDLGGDAGWDALPAAEYLFDRDARESYPHRLAVFNFESGSGAADGGATVTQTVSGITATVSTSDAGGVDLSAGLDGTLATFGSGTTEVGTTTLKVTFSGTVNISSIDIVNFANGSTGTYNLNVDTGTDLQIDNTGNSAFTGNLKTLTSASTPNISTWTSVNSIEITYTPAASESYQPGFDNIVFTSAAPANNLPALGGTPDNEAIDEASTNQAIDLSAYNISDADGDTITLTLGVDTGTIATTDGNGTTGGVTIVSSGTGTMTLAGTAANLNTYLNDSSKVVFTPVSSSISAVTLTVTPNDGTGDGSNDTVTITINDITAASTSAAGFNTTNGTNLTPGITFGTGGETLTIADASHITSTSVANGGGGTDTLVLSNGGDLSTTGFTLTGFENLTLNSGVNATMTVTQHEAFTTVTGTGTNTVTLNGTGSTTAETQIENYTLANGGITITLSGAAQNVTGSSGADTINVNGLTVTGTLNGNGDTDTLQLGNNANISGAAVSNVENLSVNSGASVTMTEAQHDGFSAIDGTDTNLIALSSANGDGAVTGDADIENYNLDAAITFTLGAAGQNVTGNAGASQTVQSSASIDTLTGTLNGGSGGSDTLVLDDGDNISGATVSNFENLTLSGGASVTMTEDQHDAFSSVTAPGADVITISAATNGFQTQTAVEKYILGVANATTIAGGAQDVTGSGGNDTITFQGLTYTGTLSGGAGTDVIQMTSGTDISGATISGIENLTLAGNASVTMTLSQLNGFSGTITAGGSETVTLSGDGNFSTVANLEIYNLGDDSTNARTITVTNAGHSVSATSATDAVTFDAGGLTLTGTLTGEGSVNDTLSLGNGANISGATISGIEGLTLGSGASATMTTAQLNGFTGTISADGTNTITLTSTGTLSNSNLGAVETIATASGGAETITLTASAASGKTLTATDTGADHFVVTGSAGAQGITGSAGGDTIDGGAGADTLGGGAGTDSLTGGADTDQFTGSVSDLNGDTITDLASGETILLTDVTGLTTANVRFNGSSVQIDTDATDFGSPEVTITTSTDLSSSLTISSVADSGSNTLITLGSASVSATTNAAGFNTTNGTNLTPASTFAGTDDTLTVADASHITSTSVANGGGGTDTIVLADGSDLTTTGFTFTSFETASLSANASVTMSENQHDAFGTINGNSGTESITLNAANGDGNVTGDADIETYNLNGAFTFTLGAAGQSVTGNAGANQTVQSSASIDTLTGTLNGGTGGSDTLVLDDGDNIAGATVSNFENLTLGSGASVSMTAAQLGGFTGTVTAAGTETITLTATGNASGASLAAIETIATAADASAQTVTLTAIQAAGKTLTAGDAGSDHFVITGSAGNQAITGSAGGDTIDGGAGNDSLYGFTGADFISGGDGADLLVGNSGADTLNGGAGNDTFSGSASDFNGDLISGLAAGDVITINSADLTALNGTTLGSTINLGGPNTLNFSGAASNLKISASINGGNTTLTFATPVVTPPSSGGGSSGPVVVTDNPTDTSTGGARTITNNGSTSGSAAIVQNTGNNGNIVTATLPANTSISSEGPAAAQSSTDALNTLITAIDNRDSTAETDLIGGARTFLTKLSTTTMLDVRTIIPTTTNSSLSEPIVITGTDGGTQSEAFVIDLRSLPSGSTLQLDNIEFASIMGNATVNGGAGQNYVTGDDNSQFISLGAEDDTLYGGGGTDTIGSGYGEDILYGNQGSDLVFGGGGMDTLYGGQDADTVRGDNDNDFVYGNKGNDTLSGGENDDVLFGGQNDDIVYGNTGNDSLNGNLGNDTLFGGQGNDLISGQAGDDRLAGNKGDDTLIGGDGADTFVFQFGGGNDRVEDFQAGTDSLEFQSGLTYTASENAGSTVLTLSDGGTVTLVGVSPSELGLAARAGWEFV